MTVIAALETGIAMSNNLLVVGSYFTITLGSGDWLYLVTVVIKVDIIVDISVTMVLMYSWESVG